MIFIYLLADDVSCKIYMLIFKKVYMIQDGTISYGILTL